MDTAYIWSYRVKPEWRTRFREAYGPNGEWTQFFSRSADYIRTDFFAGEKDESRFVTIDYFRSLAGRAALVAKFAAEYEAIDRRWQDATEDETYLGAFQVAARV